MFKTPIHTILKALILVLLVQPAMASERLTVVITVDGLNQSNLDILRPYWTAGGFRILSEEAYQTTFGFDQEVYGGNETTATIFTGTTPAHHGYTMDAAFSRTDRLPHALLLDPTEKGIHTDLAYSPRQLLAPTIGDYLRMKEGAASKIYAVGINPETTILMAGHSANACCWLQADQACWASTSFYSEGLPNAADQMNVSGRMADLASRHWTPRLGIGSYLSPTPEEMAKPFDYTNATVLAHSPMANTMVIELALAIQQEQQLGLDQHPDLLFLQLTTITPHTTTDLIQSAEQEDIYLGLNQDIGFLMEQLNKRVGKANYNLVIIGRPIFGMGRERMEKAGIPVRELHIDRVAALTSTYLMAIYGHERWIDGIYGNTLYLNRTLIEQRKISLTALQRKVADFLMEFEGIALAFPSHEALLHPDYQPQLNKYGLGDVVFSVLPGWQLTLYEQPLDRVIDIQPTAPLLYWSNSFIEMPTHPLSATDICNLIK